MLIIKVRKYLTMTNCVYVLVGLVGTLLSYHFYFGGAVNIRFSDERRSHVPRSLSDADLALLAGLTNHSYFEEALHNILVPRVVGTPSHERVKEYIRSELESIGLSVEYDSFQDVTPNFGPLTFTNIIGRLGAGERFLALACHYDSKYFPQFEFLGATDSAVPCAILLHLARVLAPFLKESNSDVSLMLIFFDGEEAFENWSPTDSIYGARNLADKWSKLVSASPRTGRRATHLERMDMLVLLDLLGTKDAKFYSFFPQTERWHRSLAQTERRLKAAGLIPSSQPLHFLEKSTFLNYIEDDHIPFLRRDVPVLHVIPHQFPEVWHTARDDFSALDLPTVLTLNKVLQVFTFAYLHGGEGTL